MEPLPRLVFSGRLRFGLEADRRRRRPQQTRGESRQGPGGLPKTWKGSTLQSPAPRCAQDVRLSEPQGQLRPGRPQRRAASADDSRQDRDTRPCDVRAPGRHEGARLRRASSPQRFDRTILPGELSRDCLRQMAELHRQLRRDLCFGEVVEQLQDRAALAGIDEHCASAANGLRPALAGIAAIVVMRARPDVLEPLVARHRAHGP